MPQVKSAREETEKQYKQELERGKQEVEQVPHLFLHACMRRYQRHRWLCMQTCALAASCCRRVFCTRACVPAWNETAIIRSSCVRRFERN